MANHRAAAHVALGTTLALLSACIPLVGIAYWAPAAEVGQPVHTGCSIGSPDTLEHRIGNVTLQIRAYDGAVHVRLLVPADSSVAFKTDEVRIGTAGLGDTAIARMSVAHDGDFELRGIFAMDPREEMKGQSRRHVFGTDPRIYEIIVEFNRPSRQEYYVVLPALIADRRVLEPVTITFRRTRGWAVVPLNC